MTRASMRETVEGSCRPTTSAADPNPWGQPGWAAAVRQTNRPESLLPSKKTPWSAKDTVVACVLCAALGTLLGFVFQPAAIRLLGGLDRLGVLP